MAALYARISLRGGAGEEDVNECLGTLAARARLLLRSAGGDRCLVTGRSPLVDQINDAEWVLSKRARVDEPTDQPLGASGVVGGRNPGGCSRCRSTRGGAPPR
jgi:hypothetical protein